MINLLSGVLLSHPRGALQPPLFGVHPKSETINCGHRSPRLSRPEHAGRDTRYLPRPFGLGSTMHRAGALVSNATGRLYN